MSREIVIVETGTANMGSIEAGLNRVGVTPLTAKTPEMVMEASHVVVPGVGAFEPARRRLRDDGLDDAVAERVASGRPTLAICVGMQLLCEDSEENTGERGLAAIAGTLDRFTGDVRIPHLGWNRVVASPDSRYVRSGFAYFAHSYRLTSAPSSWTSATTDYGGLFVSAVESGGILACQFHPELSSSWGLSLLERWINLSPEAALEPC